jgi:hypothetical protein
MARDLVPRDDGHRVMLVQGGYYVLTGVAPFVSRRAFERVTGPKLEWWLVQTVGGLATTIGGALVSAAVRRSASRELVGLAVGSAVSFSTVDVVHVVRGRIARTYLLDAGIQLGLLAAYGLSRRR